MNPTNYYNPNANYFQPGQGGNPSGTLSSPSVITPQTLAPVTPLQITPYTPIPIPNISGLPNGAQPGTPPAGWDAQTYANFKAANPALEPTAQDTSMMQNAGASTQANDLLKRISSLTGGNQEVDTATAIDTATAPYQSQLNEINQQIQMHQAQAIADQEAIGNRVGGTAFSNSTQNQTQARTNAIEGLRLAAVQAGLQGNIALAEKQATNAIAAQYADRTRQIQDAKTNIYQNYDSFTPEEKKRADATLLSLDSQDALVKQHMEDSKASAGIIQMAIQQGGINGNPVPNMIIAQAQRLTDPTEVTALLAPYLKDANAIQKAIDDHNRALADIAQSKASTANSIASTNKTKLETEQLKNPQQNSNISQITGKPLTDSERVSLGYAERAQTSDATITSIGNKFTGPENIVQGLVPSALKSDERQKYEQAQRNFVNAVLRKESGAAISSDEFSSASKQYFPQAGDGPQTVAQKAINRQQKVNSLYFEGGQTKQQEVQDTQVVNGVTYVKNPKDGLYYPK